MEPKAVIRQRVLALRDALPEEERRKRSRVIHERLRGLSCFQEAKVALFYASFRSEVETFELIEGWLSVGKMAFLPVVVPDQKRIVITRILGLDELRPGFREIPEPGREQLRPASVEDVELIVVPGVAFDLNGHRLGYGGGYYDRFLSGLAGRSIEKIGLAFELQLLPELPASAHDVKVDAIVTEERIILPSGEVGEGAVSS